MKIRELIKLFRYKETEISIRENDSYLLTTEVKYLPDMYYDREIADIIASNYGSFKNRLESQSFIINIK